MEDILAILFIFGGGAAVLLAYSPIGKAIADRIRGRELIVHDPELIEDLNQMREDLAMLHERVDFSERLLADRRAAEEPRG